MFWQSKPSCRRSREPHKALFCAEVQVNRLRAEGAEKVFREAASGAVTSLAFMVGHNFQAMMEREKSSRTVNR